MLFRRDPRCDCSITRACHLNDDRACVSAQHRTRRPDRLTAHSQKSAWGGPGTTVPARGARTVWPGRYLEGEFARARRQAGKPSAMRSEPSRCTRPYGAPRRQAKRAEKRDPCLSIALRRCEFGSRPLFLSADEGVSPHPARLFCLLSWQDKKVGRRPEGVVKLPLTLRGFKPSPNQSTRQEPPTRKCLKGQPRCHRPWST